MTKERDLEAEGDAIRILDAHRIMAIATNRSDGWPQNTIVGYANVGLLIYFMVFRASQKLLNISADGRVAIAVGDEPSNLNLLEAIYAGALAAEVTDLAERDLAWKLLTQRHPNLTRYDLPDGGEAAVMKATCKYVSVLNYSKRFGRAVTFSTDDPVVSPASPPSVSV